MSKPAIICVDDEPTVLESLKIELKQIVGDTCLIETAESAEEALELFDELQTEHYEVALVLADQIMPGIRGDEFLEQIHARSPQTLNVMISGHADLEVLRNAIRGARLYRFLPKPWKSEELRAAVTEAVQSYLHHQEMTTRTAQLQQINQELQQSIDALKQTEQELWQQAQREQSLNRVFLAFAMQQFQSHQAVQLQVEALEHLNQLKDRFLNSISHELRSPISNIRMATQMLEVRLQQLGLVEAAVNCDRYFQILKHECQREADLINDLLDLNRLDTGEEPLNLSTVNLKLWIPHIIEPFTERIAEKQQRLIIDLPPDLPPFTSDLSHLERILTELLDNACKYTPAGESITITAQLHSLTRGSTFDSDPSDAWSQPANLERDALLFSSRAFSETVLSISMQNCGIEIPEEERERIFQQFYRIPNSDFWQQGGTGLGLALARKRAEKLQGCIDVSSNSGCTIFTLKLPLNW